MGSPELWRWIWLGVAGLFAVGEMSSAGTFFLLPFAIGAVVATVLAFAGADVAVQWAAFVAVSAVAFAAFRPLARRLDADERHEGIGARRWIGQHAKVLTEIPAGADETGLVRIGREEWRAGSLDGSAIPAGTAVRVVDVVGTRLVVWPAELDPGSGPVGDPS